MAKEIYSFFFLPIDLDSVVADGEPLDKSDGIALARVACWELGQAFNVIKWTLADPISSSIASHLAPGVVRAGGISAERVALHAQVALHSAGHHHACSNPSASSAAHNAG